ncbi:uncharacterized protein J7T54_003917 [Emericellopsis cladophorae]|uniref:Uncharacterized protein n=1 Tax=Emericellopsis cladophorae TaxID=2686198 RepID=A0A9Q0BD99_9HYPO|nr:uncharacterized protein J7T54_003917 [Emericellopsis cladophorae]KAI6781652.1 hypothetical protein J7T54_003917 [Emericellopsis cladophorae]
MDQENKESKVTSTAKSMANPEKRKFDANNETDVKALLFLDNALDVDEDDDRLQYLEPKGCSCQQARLKIRNWLEAGAMEVGEFQLAIGGCDADCAAARFFRKRELQGLSITLPKSAKKAKTGTDAKSPKAKEQELLDVSAVILPGEKDMSEPVFDMPKEARKRIRGLQCKGISQAAIARALTSALPADSYVLFEKKRLKEGKPKSKTREEMEDVHGPTGVDIGNNSKGTYWVITSESEPYNDPYGKLRTYQRR